MTTNVAVIIGSLRKDSFTRKIVKAAAGLAPKSMKLDIAEIGDLPIYNQDNDANPAAAVTAFKAKIAAADAILFATPEHNRSVPAALKNAIDTASRPYGQSMWNGKPAAIISTSMGALGGFGANHHLRQSLAFLNMVALQQPEAYVGHSGGLVGGDGKFASEETTKFITAFLQAFEAHVARFRG